MNIQISGTRLRFQNLLLLMVVFIITIGIIFYNNIRISKFNRLQEYSRNLNQIAVQSDLLYKNAVLFSETEPEDRFFVTFSNENSIQVFENLLIITELNQKIKESGYSDNSELFEIYSQTSFLIEETERKIQQLYDNVIKKGNARSGLTYNYLRSKTGIFTILGSNPEFNENGQFLLLIICENDWINPVKQYQCGDVQTLNDYITEAIEYIERQA